VNLRARPVRWLLSPAVLVLASFALIAGLGEWDNAKRLATYERERAESRMHAPVEKPLAPLFKAIQEKNAGYVREAIAKGADPNAPNDRGTLPLHFAFLKDGGWPGRLDVVEALLQGGADVNARMKNGGTALHMAVGRSSRELVELLIERGADVNASTENGRTPLMNAERFEIAQLLVARGAKWDSGETGIDPDGSRLRNAARAGDDKLIAMLVAKGADPNRATKGGFAPIVYAISGGHVAATRALLAEGAKPNVTIYDGSSLLHIAAERNQVDIARLLIDAGADVKAARKSGWTPLHVASSLCHEDFSALLVRSGADTDARDKHGKTPLPCYAFAKRPASSAIQVACR
jgi:ankyrin repeat protein